MRQGQQNRRGRGRNNGSSSNNNNNNNGNNNHNRKGQNPLTRSFESTGPDVKIRGTPAHIGEKYQSLARDAAAAGDPVLAENYLQHAEHYNRIIMAFREQQIQQGGGDMINGGGRPRPSQNGEYAEGADEDAEYDGEEGSSEFGQPAMRAPERSDRGDQQPRNFDGQRGDDRYERQNRPRGDQHHQQRAHRERQPMDRDRQPSDRQHGGGEQQRTFAPDRQGQERPQAERQNYGSHEPAAADPQAPSGSRGEPMPRRREPRFQPAQQHEQPEFLRRPVRRPRRDTNGVDAAEDPDSPVPSKIIEETSQD